MAFANTKRIIAAFAYHNRQLPLLEETDEFILEAKIILDPRVYDDIFNRKRIGFIKINKGVNGIPFGDSEYVVVTLSKNDKLYVNYGHTRVYVGKKFLIDAQPEMTSGLITEMLQKHRISVDYLNV